MDTTMQQLHQTQIEIMEVIDTFCQQHGIPYSLYAGSLLGAVRHRGFIPWDDDLDICMLRRDYDRFIDLWQKSPPAGYLLQNKENAPNFGQSFTKIRKDHTTFLQAEKDIGKFHNGIFVDIFPMDRLPRGRMARKFFFADCIFYLLYTRGYVPPRGNPVIKAVSHILLRCTPSVLVPGLRRALLQRITRFADDHTLELVTTETIGALGTHYPAALPDEWTRLPFEGRTFQCFARWDESLRLKFGDYMQLPPEAERVWKHHPIVIDFEHNLEELERFK